MIRIHKRDAPIKKMFDEMDDGDTFLDKDGCVCIALSADFCYNIEKQSTFEPDWEIEYLMIDIDISYSLQKKE